MNISTAIALIILFMGSLLFSFAVTPAAQIGSVWIAPSAPKIGSQGSIPAMIPWSLIDTAPVPGGGENTLRLMQRGAEFSIMLGQNELMNSRLSGSEEALATIACTHIKGVTNPHLLIGGLGMGFTLRAALAELADEAKVVVAELMPAVVAWARGPLAHIFSESLTDPRVTIRETDVGDLIKSRRSAFDAILLDVDNGPDGLVREANGALYDAKGLNAAYAALRPMGILAVWSSGPDRNFTQRLLRTGFSVEEMPVRANGKRGGARQVIWKATRVK